MFSYLVRRRPRVLNINKKRRNWNVSDEFFSPPNNYHNRLSLYLHLPWLLQCGRLTNGESFASLGSSSREDNCFFFFKKKKVSRRVSVIIDRVVLVFFVSVCNHSHTPLPSLLRQRHRSHPVVVALPDGSESKHRQKFPQENLI